MKKDTGPNSFLWSRWPLLAIPRGAGNDRRSVKFSGTDKIWWESEKAGTYPLEVALNARDVLTYQRTSYQQSHLLLISSQFSTHKVAVNTTTPCKSTTTKPFHTSQSIIHSSLYSQLISRADPGSTLRCKCTKKSLSLHTVLRLPWEKPEAIRKLSFCRKQHPFFLVLNQLSPNQGGEDSKRTLSVK